MNLIEEFEEMNNKDKLTYVFILLSTHLIAKGFDMTKNIQEYKKNCTK